MAYSHAEWDSQAWENDRNHSRAWDAGEHWKKGWEENWDAGGSSNKSWGGSQDRDWSWDARGSSRAGTAFAQPQLHSRSPQPISLNQHERKLKLTRDGLLDEWTLEQTRDFMDADGMSSDLDLEYEGRNGLNGKWMLGTNWFIFDPDLFSEGACVSFSFYWDLNDIGGRLTDMLVLFAQKVHKHIIWEEIDIGHCVSLPCLLGTAPTGHAAHNLGTPKHVYKPGAGVV